MSTLSTARLASLSKDELVAKARRLMARAQSLSAKADQGMEVAKISGVGMMGAVIAGAVKRYQPTLPFVENVPTAPSLGLVALAAAATGRPAQAAYWAAVGVGLSSPWVADQVAEALT